MHLPNIGGNNQSNIQNLYLDSINDSQYEHTRYCETSNTFEIVTFC